MRNVKKFANNFNLEYTDHESYVKVKFNEVKFLIKKNNSSKGYNVSSSVLKDSYNVNTQKDIIAEIIEVLDFTDNVTMREIQALNDYVYYMNK